MPIQLHRILAAWGSEQFRQTCKNELEQLKVTQLPLQQALRIGSHVVDKPLGAMFIAAHDSGTCLEVKAGIFFTSLIAGCSCADDPTPVEEQNEYCEMAFTIDKQTAMAEVCLTE